MLPRAATFQRPLGSRSFPSGHICRVSPSQPRICLHPFSMASHMNSSRHTQTHTLSQTLRPAPPSALGCVAPSQAKSSSPIPERPAGPRNALSKPQAFPEPRSQRVAAGCLSADGSWEGQGLGLDLPSSTPLIKASAEAQQELIQPLAVG